jgi:hypothetical protein
LIVLTTCTWPPEIALRFAGDDLLETRLLLVVAAAPARHGQGEEPVEVPDYVAAYILHLLAANTVLLIDAHRAQPIDS